MIYFLEAGPFVKIGYTENLRTRLNDLQVGCPYRQRMIATLEGDQQMEWRIHELAEAYRYRAEWFHLKGDLKRWLKGDDIVRTVQYDDGDIEYCFHAQQSHYQELDDYLVSIGRRPTERTFSDGPQLDRAPVPRTSIANAEREDG